MNAKKDMPPCPVARCERRCSANYLMCRAHWAQVPRPLRDDVYAAYWANSAGYPAAAEAAISAVESEGLRMNREAVNDALAFDPFFNGRTVTKEQALVGELARLEAENMALRAEVTRLSRGGAA